MSEGMYEIREKINSRAKIAYLNLNGNKAGPIGLKVTLSSASNDIVLIGNASTAQRAVLNTQAQGIQSCLWGLPNFPHRKVTLEWGLTIRPPSPATTTPPPNPPPQIPAPPPIIWPPPPQPPMPPQTPFDQEIIYYV